MAYGELANYRCCCNPYYDSYLRSDVFYRPGKKNHFVYWDCNEMVAVGKDNANLN